ncbi:unnamed protein product [Brassica oleracea]
MVARVAARGSLFFFLAVTFAVAPVIPGYLAGAAVRQLVNRAAHSSVVCFRRVSFSAVSFLYTGSRFKGCIRSRWGRLEAVIFRLSFRTTASSLGGSLSCRRRYYLSGVLGVLRVWILWAFRVLVVFSEAVGAVVSRFEGAFLSGSSRCPVLNLD